MHNSYGIRNLQKGVDYYFRVAAENEIGLGEYGRTDMAVRLMDDYGESPEESAVVSQCHNDHKLMTPSQRTVHS